MAFDKKGGTFTPSPQPSVNGDTFFSTESVGGEYQFVKVGTYGNKISFNFYKGRTGDPNKTTQYVSFDYETMLLMKNCILEPLIKQRQLRFMSGEEYPVGIWLNYAITFTDRETKQLRTLGNFIIKSEVCPTTQRNTVYLCYTNGTDEWKVALGSTALQSHVTCECPTPDNGLDYGDTRFHQFAYLISSILDNWFIVNMSNHMIGIMMNHFHKIEDKLGIKSGKNFVGKDNGNYATDSYRSSEPDAPLADDTGSFGGDMPF